MAGRSGDFRKDNPKRSEPLDASTNNPFKVHKEAHKARVQREADEHREVLQSLWNAAQADLSNRAARIEDVFVQALHSVTDLINHAIANEDPITNPVLIARFRCSPVMSSKRMNWRECLCLQA